MSKASSSSVKQGEILREAPDRSDPGWLECGTRIQEVGQSLRRETAAELRKEGIGENIARILSTLTRTRSPVRQRDLAKIVGMDKLSLGNLLHEAESSGFILRAYDRNDRRVKLIELTPEGRRLAERVEAAVENVCGRVLAHVSEEEAAVCLRVLKEARLALDA